MNQIKRQLSFIQQIDSEKKILRNTLYISPTQSSSCLENLSNELFYEIFDYLDCLHVYQAFSKLNIRFQNLITYSPILLKINLCSKSQSTLEHYCQHFIIPNKHRILSFILRDESLIDQFLKHCIIDSSFNRLESIKLHILSNRKLLWILFYLNSLPRLFSLTIFMEEEEYYYNLSDTYRLIFSLSNLKYNKFSLLSYDELDITVPNVINGKYSSIKYLVIDYSCNLNQLTSLLSQTPELCHLTCERLDDSDENMKNDLMLSNLTYISIGECQVEFDEFEAFIKSISSQLQVLSIGIIWNENYLDANRWEQLIKKHMPQLNKFHFDYNQYVYDGLSVTLDHKCINNFVSPFWLERKWFCEVKIVDREMFLSIHPYKKEWFDFDERMIIDPYSNQQKTYNRSIQLTVEGYTSIERSRLLVKNINPSCVIVQFTHLNLNCGDMPINILIEIIRLLPNLHSLQISSLSNLQLRSLSIEHAKKHLLVSVINKISKLKLDKITDKTQIQFLINLCPRIQYLEIGYMSNTDLGMIVKFILMYQMTHIPNLFFLCLNVHNANENMIQKLTMTIDLETLIDNYTIQRIGEKIFIQWKLQ